MSTNVPNLKQIGGGHRKNGQKFVDLMWNDPYAKNFQNLSEIGWPACVHLNDPATGYECQRSGPSRLGANE